MILREHYAEVSSGGKNGELFRLEYEATATADAPTITALLRSEGVLFTVATPLGRTYSGLRKETVELEGLPGRADCVAVRIAYVLRAEDLLGTGTETVSVSPAGSHPGAAGGTDLPTPSAVALPISGHHWRLRITRGFSAPLAELRCTGLCANDDTARNALLSGLRSAVVSVATPQFGTLDAMMKTEVRFEPAGLDPATTAPLLRATVVWKRATFTAVGGDFPLVEIRHTTGVVPGSCTLSNLAVGAAPGLPYALGDTLSWNGLFSGTVVQIDRQAGASGLQTASVTALDARWEMAGVPVGSAPSGSGDGAAAYAQRGYDWVFNRRGKPDRDGSSLRFSDGGGSPAYWSYGAILSLLASAYLPASLSGQPSWTSLPGADAAPGEIDLRGRDLATAIDFLLSRIGHTWTIRYGSGAALHAFDASDGTVSVPLSSVTESASAAAHARQAGTIQDTCDAVDAISAPALCQCGFAHLGTSGFASFLALDRTTSDDADYAFEYRPDFSGAAGLFPFLPARSGTDAYRLHPELAVRLDSASSSGYAPASADRAAPQGRNGVPTTACFWVSWDDAGSDWRRVTGGVEVRLDPAAILLRRRITVHAKNATAEAPRTVAVSPAEHATFRLACTLAFESDHRAIATSATPSAVTTGRRRTVPQPRIVPAFTANWAGDAFDPADLNAFQVFSGIEELVPVAGRLAAVASAIAAGQNGEKVSGEARLDYWPSGVAVGKGLALGGLLSGSDGIITAVTLRRGGNAASGLVRTCRIEASGLALSDAQGRIAPAAAARNHYLSQLSSIL